MKTRTSRRTLTFNECLGWSMNQYLLLSGLRQIDLAEVLGIAPTNMAAKLKGRQGFSPEQTALLCEVLGVTMNDLLPIREGNRWLPAIIDPDLISDHDEARERFDAILQDLHEDNEEKADSLVENRPSELYAIRDSNPGPTD